MYTKICGYTALDQKGRMRHASVPLSRSPSPIVNVKQYQSEEVPLRYSYVRASNSFHRYGRSRKRNSSWEQRRRQSRNASTEDRSSLSSKEDLLDYHPSSLRKGKFCRGGSDIWKLRSGCSSSEDLLNDEYDVSDGLVSSGIPETDGSVFSSQEDLLEPQIKCSANVFKFVRSSTSGKGSSSSSSKFSTGEGKKHLSVEKRNVLHKRMCLKPGVFSKNEVEDNLKQTPTSQTPDSLCTTDLSSELVELSPIKLKVQKAVVFTVQRLVNHLSHVCDQVEVISNKCENLQDTFRALEYEQHILSIKIGDLESQFEDKMLSGSGISKPQSSSDVLKENKYSNENENLSQDLIVDEKLRHSESDVLAKKSVFTILTEIIIKGMPFQISAVSFLQLI